MTQEKNKPNNGINNQPDLVALPALIRDVMKVFSEKITESLGDNLQSITVVGSSITADFKPGQSDINTVLVLEKQNVNALNAVASLAKPMGKKKISPPLLMTPSYMTSWY